jgi:hypothetical protein
MSFLDLHALLQSQYEESNLLARLFSLFSLGQSHLKPTKEFALMLLSPRLLHSSLDHLLHK